MSQVRARIRRLVPGVLLIAVLAGGLYLLAFNGAGERGRAGTQYTVEIDNAFGLTTGAQVRAAGVEVGKVDTLKVDPRTARALVGISIQRTDFGDLRTDATCSIEPQSLIGEYFLDCQPGRQAKLPTGGTIPVTQTTGTIPPDLVQSVMRAPQRQQLQIILSELGAGFASRGPELQQVIKRAVPALRETDQVLRLLGDNRRTLQVLTRDADTVLAALAANRKDVGRFVREARDTATISAGRRQELAESIRRLPAFLRALRPTLDDLETVATKQTPALRDLRASADDLDNLLAQLGPFADAATPALDALGEASKTGTQAVAPARETVKVARALGRQAKEPSTNLRFITEHIDDRKNAVEPSPVSPGGKGFTGLEAFLRYPFVQSQAVNLFDSRGYTLKLNALVNECGGYTNAQTAKANPERTKKCNAWLGPNQPGVTTPDPSGARADTRAKRSAKRSTRAKKDTARRQDAERQGADGAPQQQSAEDQQAPAPAIPNLPEPPKPATPLDGVLEGLRDLLPGQRPAPGQQAPAQGQDQPADPNAAQGLLDFLLGS